MSKVCIPNEAQYKEIGGIVSVTGLTTLDTVLCEYGFMRTTIDLPDTLFRKTKAAAAMRGSTMKDLIVHAIEREVGPKLPFPSFEERFVERKLPVMIWKGKRKLDLSDFDFDDLLA
jgi:hypothetical protein